MNTTIVRRPSARRWFARPGRATAFAVLAAVFLAASYTLLKELALGPSASAPQDHAPICMDSCSKAHDGVCDEGRSLSPKDPAAVVACDLGTDCGDCGPWTGHHPIWPGGPPGSPGPVAFIRASNATLMVKATTTEPSYLMPITRKEVDPDVSAMLDNYGAMEGGLTRVVHEVLAGRCAPQGRWAQPPLVLNVGANFGYYALYAAMYGCRVVAWEPVELFRAYLHHGIALNNLTHLVEVREAIVSDAAPGTLVNMTVPKDRTYWGLASVNSMNVMPHEVARTIWVPSERIDDVVDEEVLLMIVDVEGYEPQVLRSAQRLLSERKVHHLLVEHSPGVHERRKDYVALVDLPSALLELKRAGYALAHLPMKFATPWPPKDIGYGKELQPLTEVTTEALQNDIRGATIRWEELSSGCPVPEPLRKFHQWASCGEWAYATHPKGFRSSFGFNTNVWASLHFQRLGDPSQPPSPAQSVESATPDKPLARAQAGLPPHTAAAVQATALKSRTARAGGTAGGTAGAAPVELGVVRLFGLASLFHPTQSMATWHSLANPNMSTGFMECSSLGAGHQVIFRCPCREESCKEEERTVLDLASKGKMPMQ